MQKNSISLMRSWLAISLSLLLLSACGFQLRGQVDLPEDLARVYVQSDASIVLTRHLRRALINSGAQLVSDINKATATLIVENEDQQRGVLSVSETARVREYESFYAVTFSLVKNDGTILLPKQVIELRRDYSFSENVVLAKEREQASLVRDMQVEAVQAILRKIRYSQLSTNTP